MKIDTWLKSTSKKLNEAGIGTAHLDALVLLEDTLGKDRTHLLANPQLKLITEQIKKLDRQIKRRIKHEPLAYIRGQTEFYGREFCLDRRVLEPRPESETMIELLKALSARREALNIIDLGTGSGALAITAKLEIPKAKVIATDIDPKCLIVARRNARLLKANVKFLQGDLLQPIKVLDSSLTFILANLPYVPESFKINPAAMAEPRIAIFGGSDGLDIYRQFFAQTQNLKARPKFILTEAMPPQHAKLEKIAKVAGYKLQQTDDFIQVFSY